MPLHYVTFSNAAEKGPQERLAGLLLTVLPARRPFFANMLYSPKRRLLAKKITFSVNSAGIAHTELHHMRRDNPRFM